VLFSNWTGALGSPHALQEPELAKIEETVHDHGLPTSLLGFCMQPAGSTAQATSCGGVVHALHSRFNVDEWQEINLAAYDQMAPEEKTMALETLFAHLQDAAPLYIKYFPGLRSNSPPSFLTLPANTLQETTVLKLHSLAEGPSPLRLEFSA